MKTIIRENVSKIEDWVASELSLKEYVREEGITTNSGTDEDKYFCPFHSDEIASLYIDNSSRFKCFSCGRGGKFVKFYTEYYNMQHGCKINYYEGLERLAKEKKYTITKVFEDEKDILDLSSSSKIEVMQRRKPKVIETLNLNTLIRDKTRAGEIDTVIAIINDCMNGEDDIVVVNRWKDSYGRVAFDEEIRNEEGLASVSVEDLMNGF